ncbi:Hsp20/alpha crystallin family protein [Cryptosporangium minutisporangium]|uniref:Hsp20/alpha crystallin family protein n=1 Tax=Cryptosporangium minutisporangium TaxID=113569 RepID=UPI0031F18BFB
MTTVAKRPHPPTLVDLFDWVEEGIPPLGVWPALGHARGGIRLEERREKDRYVLRAELPGVNPDEDVQITVANGALTIKAERREEKSEGTRSEFRYGAFARRIDLPEGTKEDTVTATYTNGILEITAQVSEAPPAFRAVAIAQPKKK